jgi:hypothetical protein
MKEFWVNVYANYNGKHWYGNRHSYRMDNPLLSDVLLYRIHVRLK